MHAIITRLHIGTCRRAACATGLLLLATVASGQSPDETIVTEANAAFARGVENRTRILVARKHFAEAADRYRELHRRGIQTPALYLKLGDAATLADRWPEAIWAYHQGLKLDPNDTALREHLAFVRAKVVYPPANLGRPEPDVWPPWLYRPNAYEMTLIGVIAYLLACGAATVAWLRGSMGMVVAALVLGLLAVGAGVGCWYSSQREHLERATPLVVLAQNTPLQRGNGTNYPPHSILPVLPRGMEVRRLHTRGSWLQVRLSTGEVGWIPASAALVVEP